MLNKVDVFISSKVGKCQHKKLKNNMRGKTLKFLRHLYKSLCDITCNPNKFFEKSFVLIFS